MSDHSGILVHREDIQYFFALSRLSQTVGDIIAEAIDEKELLQLTINAIGIYTGWSLGRVFLIRSEIDPQFYFFGIQYNRYRSFGVDAHEDGLPVYYPEDHQTIKALKETFWPVVYNGSAKSRARIPVGSFHLFVPIESLGKLLGFFELHVDGGDAPDEYLLQVLSKIGEDVGRVLDLRESNKTLKKFQLALKYSSDHIAITDADGIVLYMNEAAKKMTGYTLAEARGRHMSLWQKEMDKEFYARIRDALIFRRHSFSSEVCNIRKNGEHYITKLHLSPVFNERSGVEFMVGIERDITKEKEIDRAKSEFVSLASHQLKTPLTIIKWYIDMLTAGYAGDSLEKQREYLGKIYNNTDRMIELIDAFLNVSRLELGVFSIKKEPINLRDKMELILKNFEPKIKEKNLKLLRSYSKSNFVFTADTKMIQIIFENLISNAIKYTPSGGEIQIKMQKKGNEILIGVVDTGIGISADQQSKIFTKFFRADNALSYKADGSGLGLYIVKTAVEKMGGKIWFRSPAYAKATAGKSAVADKGTAFFVSFQVNLHTYA